MIKFLTGVIIFSCLVLSVSNASARIKLVALPTREAAFIRLDHPQNTLIEEERALTLQAGINKVDFSWNGVSIDPDSIRLTLLDHVGEVVLLNVSYPPNEAALIWEISSHLAAEVKVRVSYLLSNIDRVMTYKLIADKMEHEVNFKNYLVLRNFSGEDFTNARVLLDQGQGFEQSIQHEETKQLLFLNIDAVALQKVWKWDSRQQPWDPQKVNYNIGIPVYYTIKNVAQSGLGKNALFVGKVRVYQQDGKGSTILLGEDNTNLVAVGEDMEIYIGDSRDIVVTQRKMVDQAINVRRNRNNRIVLHDKEEMIVAKIENFKDTEVILTLREHIDGQWEIKKCNMSYTRKDASTLEFNIAFAPQEVKELKLHYYRRNIR